VITLDVADLVVIAGDAIGIGTDAALGKIDIAVAQAALAEARLADRVIADQDTAAAAAIRLMHALLRHRPFALHGEQIAVAAGLQFLSLNGWRADLGPPATAAVVVEALACGQLSPVRAAAWLSPRLAAGTGRIARSPGRRARSPRPVSAARPASPASIFRRRAVMRDASPPRQEPFHPVTGRRGQRKPPSVIYPQVLLFVQAGFWALAAAGGLIAYVITLVDEPWPLGCIPFAWAGLAGGLATAKIMLGVRLDHSPSKRTWQMVIASELAMTGFGVLWLAIPAYAFSMLGFSGACLSLAAVLCMTRPRARQYFTGPDAEPGTTDPSALPRGAGFRRIAPASRYLVPI
jgi:hypothetical protein